MKLDIINTSGYSNPSYAYDWDSGMDIRTCIEKPITLESLDRYLFPTGIRINIPRGYEIQIRPRSGMALRKGISIVNTPATIDSGFIGEIGVILINLSKEPVTIYPGDRIAQLVLVKVEHASFSDVDHFEATTRGDNGYGSTGEK